MFHKLGVWAEPKLNHKYHEFAGPLSAADTGIVFNSGNFARGADHFDPASDSQICLYGARLWSGLRPASFVRLADRQLFQYSGYGVARTAGQVGADRRVLWHALCRTARYCVARYGSRREP